jgi:hypothetical protein
VKESKEEEQEVGLPWKTLGVWGKSPRANATRSFLLTNSELSRQNFIMRNTLKERRGETGLKRVEHAK